MRLIGEFCLHDHFERRTTGFIVLFTKILATNLMLDSCCKPAIFVDYLNSSFL